MKEHNRLLIDSQPLQVLPELAVRIGLNEAIVLQQVHYWLDNRDNKGEVKDGKKWVYNTFKQWHEDNFPFWSTRTIQRIFDDLEKRELLFARDLNPGKWDRTKCYRINYEKLNSLLEVPLRQLVVMDDDKLSQSNTTKRRNGRRQNVAMSLTETTPETTKDIGALRAPASSIFPEEDLPVERPEKEDKDRISLESSESLPRTVPPPKAPVQRKSSTPKKGDLVDGIIAYAFKPGDMDVSYYPADIQPYLKAFCEAFSILPPSKTDLSQYKFWIKQGRSLKEACAEFGTEIIQDVKKEWNPKLTAGRPMAILTNVRDLAGKKRSRPASDPLYNPPTQEEIDAWKNKPKRSVLEVLEERRKKGIGLLAEIPLPVSLNSGVSQGL